MPCCICYRCFLSYDSSSSPVNHKTASIFSVPKSIAFHLRRWSIRSCLFVFFTHVPDVTGVTDCVITLAQKMCQAPDVAKAAWCHLSWWEWCHHSWRREANLLHNHPPAGVDFLLSSVFRCTSYMWHLMAADLLHPPSLDFLLSVFWLLLRHLLMSPLLWKDSEWLWKHWIVMCCGRLHQCCYNWSKKNRWSVSAAVEIVSSAAVCSV